jgi:hypothetical protein
VGIDRADSDVLKRLQKLDARVKAKFSSRWQLVKKAFLDNDRN